MHYHVPVLLHECVEALNIHPGGIYVDVTFGGGGHSREIYNKLTQGKLIVFDQDPDAADNAEGFKSSADRSFIFVPANFRYIERYLKFHKVKAVHGILADLGVSSHHLDAAERGFSTRLTGRLDMRMDTSQTRSAREVVNEYAEEDLIHILSLYGEVRNAKTLAAAIVSERSQKPIDLTDDLVGVAQQVGPKGRMNKYLAQLFQAIRIEVNDEMGALREFLEALPDLILPGGRVVIMSYHSLEDRLVKNFLNTGNLKGKQEKDFYGNLIRPFEPVTRKPIIAAEQEIEKNSRARSAKLRIATRKGSIDGK